MTQSRKNNLTRIQYRLREGLFLLTLAVAVFLFLSLLTYSTQDPGWSATGLPNKAVVNWGGRAGAFIADVLFSIFGITAYFFPIIIAFSSWLNRQFMQEVQKYTHLWLFQWLGWLCFMIGFAALAGFYFKTLTYLPAAAGGIAGDLADKISLSAFNKAGSTLFFVTLLLFGLTLLTGVSWASVIEKIGALLAFFATHLWKACQKKIAMLVGRLMSLRSARSTAESAFNKRPPIARASYIRTEPVIQERTVLASAKPLIAEVPRLALEKPEKLTGAPAIAATTIKLKQGALPPTTLLNASPPFAEKSFDHLSLEELSTMVEQRLLDFGVEAKVVSVLPGPVITRFELDLAPGIKVSKITGLAKDIARSLSVVSVRVVEVIPGKSVIGLEIPNQHREIVTLRDIIESKTYAQSRSPISLVLGKDISGHPVIVDLSKMPHLLVAGTTGSGKSVSLNAMLLSMLFKAPPEQLRLILIDPKMLELSLYDGIPHLLTPVITDMKDAANALRWCVAEMDKRYRLMASQGVRNLIGYNQKVSDAIKQGQPIPLPSILVTDEASAKVTLEPLPVIVVVADELADMMMLVGKKIEDLIARIAQKARAAGIHLILATQRPSVDVITGLIKANIPTRIAFQVSSRIDSRTILDQQGAEQLLGHGDMLYLPPGAGVPIRVHGAYVADEEVHRVVAVWRNAGTPTYLHEVTEDVVENSEEGEGESAEQDPLYDTAVQIILESRRASISLVQRRLRIGYNRAARMMEAMERAGLVSTMDNNGAREVLTQGE